MAFKMVGTYSPSGSATVSLIAQLLTDSFSFSLDDLTLPMLCTLSTAVIRQVDCDSYFPYPSLHRLAWLQRQAHPTPDYMKVKTPG